MREFFTASPEETMEIGALLAKDIAAGRYPTYIALYGDLGVGKTVFVRGLASVLAPGRSVKSPTYTIVNEYKGEKLSVFHFDMYRIADDDELYNIGYYDYLSKGLCVVEWSENIPYALPDSYLKVTVEKVDPLADADRRKITIEEIRV